MWPSCAPDDPIVKIAHIWCSTPTDIIPPENQRNEVRISVTIILTTERRMFSLFKFVLINVCACKYQYYLCDTNGAWRHCDILVPCTRALRIRNVQFFAYSQSASRLCVIDFFVDDLLRQSKNISHWHRQKSSEVYCARTDRHRMIRFFGRVSSVVFHFSGFK